MVRYLLNIQVFMGLLLFWVSMSFAHTTGVSPHEKTDQNMSDSLSIQMNNSEIYATLKKDELLSLYKDDNSHVKVNSEGFTQRELLVGQTDLSYVPRKIHIGYGRKRNSDAYTGAVGVVQSHQITAGTEINPENTLFGKIPGLMVLQNGGGPPTYPDMFIRGRETFNNSSILVLVDGFERPLSSISTSEIESITVLKDAAALALYGQRGANGVLLVNTKRGSANTLKVTASIEKSFTQPTALPEFLGAPEYARAVNEAHSNDGRPARFNQLDIDGFDSGTSPFLYPDVNWFDQTLRDYGTQNNVNMTFKGGGERARFFVATNYANDYGILNPISSGEGYSTQRKYERFNFRSNIDINITEDLLFRSNVAGHLSNSHIPAGNNFDDIFNSLYTIPSAAFPIVTPTGNWGGTQIYGNNPVADLTSTGFGNPNGRELFLDGSLIQIVTQGLSVEIGASFTNFGEYLDQQSQQYRYEVINPIRNDQGIIIDTTMTTFGENTDLSFSNPIGQFRRQSNVHALVDYEVSLDNNDLKAMVLFDQDTRVLRGQNNTFHRRNFAGNVHYGIAGKYFIDVTASYSGNNLLPPGEKYNFFPAVSAAWILSREEFIPDNSFLSFLKLRASWGLSGNDLLPANNPYEQSYNSAAGYWFQNANNFMGGFAEGQLATSNFTVEISNKSNVGIDLILFDRLDITADMFYARRSNILTGTGGSVSNVIGIAPPIESDGIVENRGIDVAVNWTDHFGEFNYHIGGQFSFARNKIVEMNEEFRPYSYLRRTGHPIGQFFGLEVAGFFEDEQDIANSPTQVFSEVRPGDIKYVDQNGDGIINEFDMVPLGYSGAHPEMYFSALFGFGYKGFSVSALFQGTANHTVLLNTQSVYWPLINNNTISTYYYENRWTPETSETASYPRLTTEGNDNNFRSNDLWLRDRSYIKLRSLEISYSLPVTVTSRLNMEQIRLFARGFNLFSLHNIEMLDPERLSVGYPSLRSYNLGMDIAF